MKLSRCAPTMSYDTVMTERIHSTITCRRTNFAIITVGIILQRNFNGSSKSACGLVGRWKRDPNFERSWLLGSMTTKCGIKRRKETS
jgi:hypothetical protein